MSDDVRALWDEVVGIEGRAVLEQKDVRVHVLFDDEGTPYPHP